jgi:hypothetical protein
MVMPNQNNVKISNDSWLILKTFHSNSAVVCYIAGVHEAARLRTHLDYFSIQLDSISLKLHVLNAAHCTRNTVFTASILWGFVWNICNIFIKINADVIACKIVISAELE